MPTVNNRGRLFLRLGLVGHAYDRQLEASGETVPCSSGETRAATRGGQQHNEGPVSSGKCAWSQMHSQVCLTRSPSNRAAIARRACRSASAGDAPRKLTR